MAVVALVTVAVLATALAGSDLIRRRLPNSGVVALALAVVTLLVAGRPGAGLAPLAALALGAGAGAVGVAVWAAGLVAAGDAKVVGPVVAVEVWMGSGPMLVWLGLTVVGTGAGLVWLLAAAPQPAAASGPTAGGGKDDGTEPAPGHRGVPLGSILLAGVAPSAVVLGLGVWG